MNFGEEFTVPQGKELPFTGRWLPVTPQKPIQARSAPISENEQGIQFGSGNWQELDGFPPRYAQELLNYSEMVLNFNPFEQMGHTGTDYVGSINLTANNQMLNNIAGSSTQVFQNESMGWSDNTLVNLLATRNTTDFALPNDTACISRLNSGPVSVLQSQADNWGHSSLLDLRCTDQRPSASFPNSDDFYQLPHYRSAIPYKPMYNLNSTPWKEVGAASHIITSLESSSKAQHQSKETENKQLNTYSTSVSDESLIHEKEKQEHAVASNRNEVCRQSSELLQNIVNSSSAFTSSPKEENRNSERGSDEGIDLNMTPKQKPPKRRKHRPKVIVEGKPKRTPKSATTKNIDSKDNPSAKRKYVRRKGLSESATELADLTKESDPKAGTLAKRRYIRKKNMKDLATEQLNSTKEPNPSAGITLSQTCAQKKNQEESTIQQADCTRSSDSSSETAWKESYIHKNGLEASETPQVDCMKETENDPNPLFIQRSCRRELNFDLGNAGNQSQADKLQEMPHGRKSSESQAMGLQIAGNSRFKVKQSTQTGQQTASSNQPQIGSSHSTSITMTPIDCRTMSHIQAATATQLQQKGLQTGNLNVHASNASTSEVKLSQMSYRDGYTPTQQNIHPTQISQFLSRGANYQEYTDWSQNLVSERLRQSVPTALCNPNEGRGSKRGNSNDIEQEQCYASSSMTSLLSQGIFQMNGGYINRSNSGETFLQALKRKKIEDESRAYIYSMSYGMPHGIGKLQTKGTNNVIAKELTSPTICGTSDPQFHSAKTARRSSGVSELTEARCVHSIAAALTSSKQPISFQQHSGMLRNVDRLTLVHNSPTIENTNHHLPTTLEKAPMLQFRSITKTSNNNVSEKKRRETVPSRRAPSGRGKMLQEQYEYQQSSTARGSSAKEVYPIPIEEITNKFMGLTLNEKNRAKAEAQNALVIYKGVGTVVPYEGFESIKRRKPRPKVDLDPETNRIWNLLMGKDKVNTEGTDKEKEKWWEEERTVFQGRVGSFVARMILVQGDRKFTKWKGSVVDSIIGVFLTQNVSDQLSSSAFMSLAARFPLKSSCKSDCNQDGEKIQIEEPEVCEPNTKETIKWHENLFNQQFDSQSSITLNASTERNSFTETHGQNLEEEVFSSQGSFDSSVIQTIGGIRSYSGSNSETEDPTTGCKFSNNHGSTVDQMENSASFDSKHYNCLSASSPFQEIFSYKQLETTESGQELSFVGENLKGSSSFNQASHFRDQKLQVQAVDVSHHQLHMTLESEAFKEWGLEPCAEECISSWASNVSGLNKLKQRGQCEGKIMVQQNEPAISQDTGTAVLNTSSREHIMNQHEVPQQGTSTKSNHLCNSHKEQISKAFQSESISVPMPLTTDATTIMQKSNASNALKHTERPPAVGRTSALNKDKYIESKDAQYNRKEHMNFSNRENGGNSTLKPKRRKAEEGKTDATDWDALRKEALANGWNSERSKDCMDSLDYEAMRNADVNEISSTIKERGMNNLLAQRIKAFLNRMVKEHNSIDLEWLKHVPPDKAKDFLLSIWGLGLKSVECVRLLTLHHVAFPVDTNVGRIAVRLGWVPLQPLPESLQLHLLELYPILESIQKYLWPRLCKLDQRELYELHYHLITFGKVFCTKSKPNCNACPMRAECRHFASAFASARLALPGPEERGITSSTVPQMSEEKPFKIVIPMPLPAPYNNLIRVEPKNGHHEPIIEEPATPEPEQTEDSNSDIEDASHEDVFHEDSEEIPTINLNIEEFTANLQHYMQAGMEVQESDLSKALVALNPQAASIPTPKLKNVSRLRTEHYVYELPDDHSLLKGMERRHPDDPCPYLLAIWSPGETATSIQPPERSCGSQELGTLCNDNTCFSCNSVREANAQTVRGTLLIPCRTAMRGSFPLNGTYFQVNEVFADHKSSINPMNVPREWIWKLPRRTVYFGTSVSSIFKGLSTEGIQYCFWRGFVCVRGFDQETRAPRPLLARLHFPASKLAKTKTEDDR